MACDLLHDLYPADRFFKKFPRRSHAPGRHRRSDGRYVERHYIHYEIPRGYVNLPIQSGVSVALLFVWKTYFEKAMVIPLLGGHWGNLVSRFVMHFIALTLIPMLIMKSARESGYVDQAASSHERETGDGSLSPFFF